MCDFLTPTNSPIPAHCPTIPFDSDTNCADPVDEGSGPQDSPHFRCQPQMGFLGRPRFYWANCKLGGSPDPFLRFHNFLEWLTELSETLYLHLPVYDKASNSRTTEWKRFPRAGMGVGQGTSMPIPPSGWAHHLPRTSVCPPTQKLITSHCPRVSVGLSLQLLPLPGSWWVELKANPLITGSPC